eukprot:759589-Hanusia_phi.AAC.4
MSHMSMTTRYSDLLALTSLMVRCVFCNHCGYEADRSDREGDRDGRGEGPELSQVRGQKVVEEDRISDLDERQVLEEEGRAAAREGKPPQSKTASPSSGATATELQPAGA